MSQKISRLGVYAIIHDKGKILLTTKTKGPYKGLYDLPGGKIEFKETVEQALQRELKEEVALSFSAYRLYGNFSHTDTYKKTNDEHFVFHHIGLLYFIEKFASLPNCDPEDISAWYAIDTINENRLTPFAKIALKKIKAIDL